MFGQIARFGQFLNIFQNASGEGTDLLPRTWYDPYFDFLLRLVRPLFIFGFFLGCLEGWRHPERMKEFAIALKEMPDIFMYMVTAVILSVAVPKMIQSSRAPGAPMPDFVKDKIDDIKEEIKDKFGHHDDDHHDEVVVVNAAPAPADNALAPAGSAKPPMDVDDPAPVEMSNPTLDALRRKSS